MKRGLSLGHGVVIFLIRNNGGHLIKDSNTGRNRMGGVELFVRLADNYCRDGGWSKVKDEQRNMRGSVGSRLSLFLSLPNLFI